MEVRSWLYRILSGPATYMNELAYPTIILIPYIIIMNDEVIKVILPPLSQIWGPGASGALLFGINIFAHIKTVQIDESWTCHWAYVFKYMGLGLCLELDPCTMITTNLLNNVSMALGELKGLFWLPPSPHIFFLLYATNINAPKFCSMIVTDPLPN